MTRLLLDFLKYLSRTFLGWCPHSNHTFPRKDVDGLTSVVCLDCTTRFEYDWEHMLRGKPVPEPVTPRPTLHKEVAL